jgi:cytochrome P450
MVANVFMPKRVEAQRPRVQKLVDGLIDAMENATGPIDLLQDFSLPIPTTIISVVLGVPHDDHEFFQSRSQAFLSNSLDHDVRQTYIAEFDVYLEQLLESKRVNPAEDVITHLATLVDDGVLTREQAMHDLQLLIVAGHHSTANMITLAAYALMQEPARAEEIRQADDPRLVAAAVEELLRYVSVLHSGRRRAVLEDFELGGHEIKAGEGLIIANDAGNWDPAAFDHADALDFHRASNQHGAFGFGVHQCLGQHLARVELQVALTTLFRRLPGLRSVTPAESLDFKDHDVIYGIGNLFVTWDGRSEA